MKAQQERVFRLAQRDHGLTLKAIGLDSGLSYDSLRNYASGETEMPLSAFYALVGVIPSELLSLLLPGDHVIVRVPEGVNHDDLAEQFADWLLTKERAHHPDSEAGREIGPGEDSTLRGKFAVVVGGRG